MVRHHVFPVGELMELRDGKWGKIKRRFRKDEVKNSNRF